MTSRSRFILGSVALAAAFGNPESLLAAESTAGTTATPDELLRSLQDGNRRFVAGDLPDPKAEQVAARRAALVEGQHPGVAVLSCADSRVVPNLAFVQGAGDLFVCRVAGNFAAEEVLGSLEYAVAHLSTKLIVVLGHEKCGAVEAVYDAISKGTPLPPHLNALEAGMGAGIKPVVASKGTLNDAVIANVKANVAKIRADSAVIEPAIAKGHVRVVGAEYYLGTGRVVFFA